MFFYWDIWKWEHPQQQGWHCWWLGSNQNQCCLYKRCLIRLPWLRLSLHGSIPFRASSCSSCTPGRSLGISVVPALETIHASKGLQARSAKAVSFKTMSACTESSGLQLLLYALLGFLLLLCWKQDIAESILDLAAKKPMWLQRYRHSLLEGILPLMCRALSVLPQGWESSLKHSVFSQSPSVSMCFSKWPAYGPRGSKILIKLIDPSH